MEAETDAWQLYKLYNLGFLSGSVGKESACNAGEVGLSLGRKDPLEKEMAIHSSTLAWRILWTEDWAGHSSGDPKELDMKEKVTFTSL